MKAIVLTHAQMRRLVRLANAMLGLPKQGTPGSTRAVEAWTLRMAMPLRSLDGTQYAIRVAPKVRGWLRDLASELTAEQRQWLRSNAIETDMDVDAWSTLDEDGNRLYTTEDVEPEDTP